MSEEQPAPILHIFERQSHPFHMWDGIQSIPAALEDIQSPGSQNSIRQSAGAMLPNLPVHLLGCGTSYFAATAAALAIQQLAGLPADAWEAFEFLAYPPPGIQRSSLVGISHTGSTPPVVQAVEMARKQGACTVAYSDSIPSALTRAAQWVIPGSLGPEPALPKTRSYLAALMRGYLQAVTLAGLTGKDPLPWEAALSQAPRLAAQVLAACQEQARDLAAKWSTRRRVVVSGGGPQHATALEATLKLTETAQYNAVSWEIEEAVHGMWASTNEQDLVILLAMEGPSYAASLRLAAGMKAIGCPVWVLTNRVWGGAAVEAVTRLPEGQPEVFMPLYAILPIYLFAYFSALNKGISPDSMRMDDPRYREARRLMRSSLA